MASKENRYRKLERSMTYAILVDVLFFILYLIFSGTGAKTPKIIFAIFAIILSLAIAGYLYMTKELLRRRSLWMGLSAAAIILCILFSLVLNFPRPKFQLPNSGTSSEQTTIAATEETE